MNDTPTFAEDPSAALAAYREKGSHIEPGVWSREGCRALIEAGRLLPTFQDGTYKPCMQAHRLNAAVLEALRNPVIVGICERMVGGPISGLQTEFFFCRPGVHGFSLHQDNSYVCAKPEAFVSAWSALEDAFPENGGLIAYPGTHRLPVLPTIPVEDPPQSPSQDPNAHKVRVDLPPGHSPVHLRVPAGSVVFIHANIVHGSNPNRTADRFRHVLLSTYLRRGEAFRPGNYAKRAEVDVYGG